MSAAAKLIRRAELAGLRLGILPFGRLAYVGPPEVVARFKPALAANRDGILAELEAANERALTWWAQPVEGWPAKFTIHNIARDETAVIDLRPVHPAEEA